jgi:hypothetical protein
MLTVTPRVWELIDWLLGFDPYCQCLGCQRFFRNPEQWSAHGCPRQDNAD